MNVDIDFDVIIVGGGLSGLVTAFKIIQKTSQLSIRIFEASNRIGGQILSTRSHHELGARWIDCGQYQVNELCKQFSIELVRRSVVIENENFKRNWEIDNGIFACLARFELNKFIQKLDLISENLSFSGLLPLRFCSMEAYICNQLMFNSSRNVARLLVRHICGLHTNDIALIEFVEICHGAGGLSTQFNSLTGTGTTFSVYPNFEEITNKLEIFITPDRILKNTKVTEIIQHPDFVKIQTSDGKCFIANMVVIAIPTQDICNIKFIPDFSKKIILPILKSKCLVTSFVAKFLEPFWKIAGFSGSCMCHDPHMICYEIDENTISGMIYHDENFGNDLKGKILKILQTKFGENTSQLMDWKEKTWKQAVLFKLPSITLCNRIAWSSACSARKYRGYLCGAVESGLRSAVQALLLLRPQSLDWQDFDQVQHANVVKIKMSTCELLKASLNLHNCIFYGIVAPLTVTVLYALYMRFDLIMMNFFEFIQ